MLKCLVGRAALPWLPSFVSIARPLPLVQDLLALQARRLLPPSVNTDIPKALGLGAAEESFEESSLMKKL